MPYSTHIIKLLEEIEPSLRKVLIAILEEIERQREESITRKEFLEFARHTDENFQKVWTAINELTEAQKKSEQRLTRIEKAVEELTEAQKKTEQRVNELTEAQKKSEQRLTRIEKAVEELTEAQKKTEQRVNELTEAQKKTEAEVESLARSMKELKKMVGGLSDSVGYGLEDRIFPYIREFALKEYGIEVEILDRRNVVYPDGRYDEVNIYV
ncbi:MAG: hypothetical protein D6828_05710, partial [Nitrospirae bacterium]